MEERLLQKYKLRVLKWGKCFDKMFETIRTLIYLSEFENFELDEEERCLLTSCIKSKVSEYRQMIGLVLEEETKQLESNPELAKVCNEYVFLLTKDIKAFLQSADDVVDRLVENSFIGEYYKRKIKSDISRYKLGFGLCSQDDSKKVHEYTLAFLNEHPDKLGSVPFGLIKNFASIFAEKFGEKAQAIQLLKFVGNIYENQIREQLDTEKIDQLKSNLQEIKYCAEKWK